MQHRVKEFIHQKALYSFIAILRDWIVIALIILINVHYRSVWLYLPSVWIIGAFQFALGESMLHEAAHHNLFSKKLLNYRFEFLYALPFFRTVKQYKKEHMLHHKHLGQPADQLVADYNKFGFFKPHRNMLWLCLIKPVAGFAAYYYTINLSLKPFRPEGIKIVIFWAFMITLFSTAGSLLIIFLYWLIPLLWCNNSYLYWSEISDHFSTVTGTRSNLNRFSNFITHNNGYHYLHHKYPTIPWFNLPHAYKHFGNEKGDVSYSFFETYQQIVSNAPGNQ